MKATNTQTGIVSSTITNETGIYQFPPLQPGTYKVNETPGRITYFPGLQRVPDPSRANITTTDNLRNSSNLFAIADADMLLTAPAAGAIGTMGSNRQIGLSANLLKRIRLTETKEFEIRLDAINVLNHANFPNPTMDITSPNFGLIALPGAPGSTGGLTQNPANAGNRMFTFHARLNF